MIYLYDDNFANNNPLAIGANWFRTRNRNLCPLDNNFYHTAQINPHNGVTMVQNDALVNVNAVNVVLNAGEAVIIVAHGNYVARTLVTENFRQNIMANGRPRAVRRPLDATAHVKDLINRLMAQVIKPSMIFIAACEGGVNYRNNSILRDIAQQCNLVRTRLNNGTLRLAWLYCQCKYFCYRWKSF